MKKILYVSPVCHLVEVAAQMSICGVSGETPAAPIISPEEGHGSLGPSVAPKRIL